MDGSSQTQPSGSAFATEAKRPEILLGTPTFCNKWSPRLQFKLSKVSKRQIIAVKCSHPLLGMVSKFWAEIPSGPRSFAIHTHIRVTSARISLKHIPRSISCKCDESSSPNNGFPLQGNSVGPWPPCLIVGRPHCFPSYFKVVFFPSSSNSNSRMTWCAGVFVVVWWCFCGGVVVFLWWCSGVFAVV